MKFEFKANVGLVEFFYSTFAKLFYALWSFCAIRASALEKARVEAKYVGRYVRVTCGQKHYGRVLGGVWYVKSYDVDDGALKVIRGDACDIDSSNWVKPECVEVMS